MQTDAIFGILLTLLNKEFVTAKYLSQKYGFSVRTIYRYLNVLEDSGVPVYSQAGKNGGFSILNTFRLNNCFFTTAERVSLLSVSHLIPNESIRKSVRTKLQNL